MVHLRVPGLFKSLSRGGRKGKGLDVTHPFGNGNVVRVTCFTPLGADDARFLQTIVGLAGSSRQLIDLAHPQSDIAKSLKAQLQPKDDALNTKSITLTTTIHEILREAGYRSFSSSSRADLVESLVRLSGTTFHFTEGKWSYSFRLLGYVVNKETGELHLAIDPWLTDAVLGDRQYAHIDMREVRADLSSPARILHQYLCTVVNPGGKPWTILTETLMANIWSGACSRSALSMRRIALRSAIIELEETKGWTFTLQGDSFSISRSKKGYDLNPDPATKGQYLLV